MLCEESSYESCKKTGGSLDNIHAMGATEPITTTSGCLCYLELDHAQQFNFRDYKEQEASVGGNIVALICFGVSLSSFNTDRTSLFWLFFSCFATFILLHVPLHLVRPEKVDFY